METVIISPRFQVVIPQSVREALKLLPGEKMRALHFGDRVELFSARDTEHLRDALAGADTAVERNFDQM